MLKEAHLGFEDIPKIKSLIDHVKISEDVLVIRSGAKIVSQQRWIGILGHDCGLTSDKRHFDPDWAAREAERLLREGQSISGPSSTERIPVERQMLLTQWGEISYQPDKATSYQYSKTPQPFHTDNGWFQYPPEISFFIMEKQVAVGGEQTVYAASRLVDDLQAESPALLDDLQNIKVVIRKGDHDSYNRTTVIRYDGQQPKLAWNYYRVVRENPEIDAMCEAFFDFLQGKVETASVERIRCETGDCMSFNDLHMLHGRTAFEAQNPRDRVLLHSMWKMPQRGSQ